MISAAVKSLPNMYVLPSRALSKTSIILSTEALSSVQAYQGQVASNHYSLN